jgi:NAD(P)-dependent dehydrogenase (short-subunit alcohol dehydrogenase family)
MLPDNGAHTVSSAFEGKAVVVTGGASGIGKALAKEFLRKGAYVALLDIGDTRAVIAELSGPPHRMLTIQCDVTNEEHVMNAICAIKRSWGRIDIYCSNAGIMLRTNPLEAPEVCRHSNAQWESIFRVNVQSHVTAARELISDWDLGKGDGVFVVTASAAGLLTQIGDASYGVSKAAAISFAEHIAIAHPTIQVHCLCPQAVDTPLVDTFNAAQNSAMLDGIVSAEFVAACTLQAIEEGSFWVFPHPQVSQYVQRKAADHPRWLKGMQRLRKRLNPAGNEVHVQTSKL